MRTDWRNSGQQKPPLGRAPSHDGGVDAFVRCLYVDDAGVTQGCLGGGMGPGDRDDGGGAPAPPPPNVSPNAMNLPFGAECLDNAQCASNICYFYRVKGQFCTQLCTTSTDCPSASLEALRGALTTASRRTD